MGPPPAATSPGALGSGLRDPAGRVGPRHAPRRPAAAHARLRFQRPWMWAATLSFGEGIAAPALSRPFASGARSVTITRSLPHAALAHDHERAVRRDPAAFSGGDRPSCAALRPQPAARAGGRGRARRVGPGLHPFRARGGAVLGSLPSADLGPGSLRSASPRPGTGLSRPSFHARPRPPQDRSWGPLRRGGWEPRALHFPSLSSRGGVSARSFASPARTPPRGAKRRRGLGAARRRGDP